MLNRTGLSMDKQRKEGKVHVPTPWYDQYNTHAHNHITRAVAAKDSCFALRRAHQYDIASTLSIAITDPVFYCRGGCTSTPAAHYTCGGRNIY